MSYARTLTELGKALGRRRQLLTRWSRRPGFPRKEADGWPVEACRQWVSSNVAVRRSLRPTGEPTPAPPAAPPKASASDTDAELDALADRLEEAGSDGLEASRAAVALIGRMVASGARSGTLGPREAAGLKATLEELRRAEAGYMELQRRRGELIERDTARQVIGAMAARLDAVRAELVAALPLAAGAWVEADRRGRCSDVELRRRVRSWIDDTLRELRTREADRVEAEIEAAVRDAAA